ncbi:putative transferase CAF17, mitochondrial [Mantella aurantiaca]
MARPRILSLLSRPWIRRFSGSCCPLREHRGLLRLRGPNTPAFLQGLVTNDTEQLGERAAMYAHLLNVQGRSMFDVILYRLSTESDGQSDVLLECDIQALGAIQKHLQVYNFRKKVEVSPCPELSVWALLPGQKAQDPPGERLPAPVVVVCSPDPRVPLMGWRIVTQTEGDIAGLLPEAQLGNYGEYCKHRYQHGVAEGVKDLPPGVALPLESNLVYMNGISFSKGCYLGQELTARTHHTGVIRKRLVPVRLSPPLPAECEESEIVTPAGKAAGKYRAGVGDAGLALLRLEHLGGELQIKVGGREPVSVKATTPEWWPKPGNGS